MLKDATETTAVTRETPDASPMDSPLDPPTQAAQPIDDSQVFADSPSTEPADDGTDATLRPEDVFKS